MDELTMLVQLAGGDPQTVRRLRDAGYRGAKGLAQAEVGELRAGAGLSAAASGRLLRAAREILAPGQKKPTRVPRNALKGLPSVPKPRASPTKASKSRGVDKSETSALLGETLPEERLSPSFWRFG